MKSIFQLAGFFLLHISLCEKNEVERTRPRAEMTIFNFCCMNKCTQFGIFSASCLEYLKYSVHFLNLISNFPVHFSSSPLIVAKIYIHSLPNVWIHLHKKLWSRGDILGCVVKFYSKFTPTIISSHHISWIMLPSRMISDYVYRSNLSDI